MFVVMWLFSLISLKVTMEALNASKPGFSPILIISYLSRKFHYLDARNRRQNFVTSNIFMLKLKKFQATADVRSIFYSHTILSFNLNEFIMSLGRSGDSMGVFQSLKALLGPGT